MMPVDKFISGNGRIFHTVLFRDDDCTPEPESSRNRISKLIKDREEDRIIDDIDRRNPHGNKT